MNFKKQKQQKNCSRAYGSLKATDSIYCNQRRQLEYHEITIFRDIKRRAMSMNETPHGVHQL